MLRFATGGWLDKSSQKVSQMVVFQMVMNPMVKNPWKITKKKQIQVPEQHLQPHRIHGTIVYFTSVLIDPIGNQQFIEIQPLKKHIQGESPKGGGILTTPKWTSEEYLGRIIGHSVHRFLLA